MPAGHLFLSYSQIGLGRSLTASGKGDAAISYLRQGLTLREKRLPEGHWLIGEARFALAEGLLAIDKSEEAKMLAGSALDILISKKGKDDYLSLKISAFLKML